jgi:hypothetical protein
MNNLSLVIYLAEVIPNIGGIFLFTTIFSVIVTVISGIVYLVSRTEAYESERMGHKHFRLQEEKNAALGARIFRWATVAFCVSVIPANIIPKRDTIMMIAASEFGETALKSDDVQEIVNPAKKILKNWINDQLAQSEKKK